MATTSREDFNRQLLEFVELCRNLNGPFWSLQKSAIGELYAKNTSSVVMDDETLSREVHITFNEVYSVPTLWFNFYRRDGRPLKLSEIRKALKLEEDSSIPHLTQNEHPNLGVIFFNIHPCNTAKVMKELKIDGNYIARWITIYGAEVGISLPANFFAENP
ncbi:unnamed protein product [Caenorhabditis auriculariae]|uniref:Ubiquitin-like-conjugating enzyme ATG10 n=1 Tax=Caenorhabditis auriculariae TaxID=2777116 RepID=A0A8S1H5I8_9PELO|nr:unnamed protein product [Caenorhabditis auriculariae]